MKESMEAIHRYYLQLRKSEESGNAAAIKEIFILVKNLIKLETENGY